MQRRKETMQAQWDDIEQKPIQTLLKKKTPKANFLQVYSQM